MRGGRDVEERWRGGEGERGKEGKSERVLQSISFGMLVQSSSD